MRQGELSHLSGVLGLYHVLEHRLGDQMLQVLFHPLHHRLLLSVIFPIPCPAWEYRWFIQLSLFELAFFSFLFFKLNMLQLILCYLLKDLHPGLPPRPLLLVSTRSCGASACCCGTQSSLSVWPSLPAPMEEHTQQ